jgi:hypothetical protein
MDEDQHEFDRASQDSEDRTSIQLSVSLPVDEEGYLGRACPQDECRGYFKIRLGTGLSGQSNCRCPYCGYEGDSSEYHTPEQVEYAQSVMLNQLTAEWIETLRGYEFDYPAQGTFGLGISLKVTGTPYPITHYREKDLETKVTCESCGLDYTIYGVFGYCPDCGAHNSYQILEKNLELAQKEAALATTADGDLAAHLIADALENEVSAFDGFGREICRVHSPKATKPEKAQTTSFQNLVGAQSRCLEIFGFDLASGVTPEDWAYACRCFQKRHLLAHTMGVIDEEYIRHAADPHAVAGRKVSISSDEVTSLARILRQLGSFLVQQLDKLTTSSSSVPGGPIP